MIDRVIKRDGTFQKWDLRKIERAIMMAFKDVNPKLIPDPTPIASDVYSLMDQGEPEHYDVNIETVQDAVIEVLALRYPEVASTYDSYRQGRSEIRAKRTKIHPCPNAVADYIHPAKYGMHLPEYKRRETYLETSHRSRGMHQRKFPELSGEIGEVWTYVDERYVLPSMRSFQFGGLAIEKHNERMYNCSFTLMNRFAAFGEAFYLLLCGCGVGYSVQFKHIAEMSKLRKIDFKRVVHHTITDTIQGWGNAIHVLFHAYQEGKYVEFNYSLIRPEGAPLKTSGGKAPGHLPLKRSLEQTRMILDGAQGRKLRPIECHDILCHLAEAVLSGGIRRSSMLALFSPSDGEMVRAKAEENFQHGGLNSQRSMANNSAAFIEGQYTKADFNRIMNLNRDHGEPGAKFLANHTYGVNPCGEIGLNPVLENNPMMETKKDEWDRLHEIERCWGSVGFSFCNLVEINAAKCRTREEFIQAARAAATIATLQASYTDFPYLGQTTEEIVRREALIGVGITGIMDNPEIALDPDILHEASDMVVETNRIIASRIGINPAARCTTVKPSGTASLELGCVASGCSAHHARRYFRRITANANEPVAIYFQKVNPHMVEVKPNGDLCITFPVEAPTNAVTVKSRTAFESFKDVLVLYQNWILPGTAKPLSSPKLHHSVSATIVFEPDEIDSLIEMIYENREKVSGIALLPKTSDKGIPYMPREAVVTTEDEERYRYLIENFRPVDFNAMYEDEDGTNYTQEPACAGGQCEL